MIKDNHKSFFGGVEGAVNFFKNMKAMYKGIELEVHDLLELEKGLDLGVSHFMLDNFSITDLKKAICLKTKDVTFEVSGGIRLDTINQYLLEGIDSISVGCITYGAPAVDLSLKYFK